MRIKIMLKILPIVFVFFTIISFVRLYDSFGEMKSIIHAQNMAIEKAQDTLPKDQYESINRQVQSAEKSANITMFSAILVNSAIIILVWRVFGVISAKIEESNILGKFAYQISEGNFETNPSLIEAGGDFGLLAQRFTDSMNSLVALMGSIKSVSALHNQGDVDALPDVSGYKGLYGEASHELSKALKSYGDLVHEVSCVLESFAQGDYEAKLTSFPGKKADINKSVELLRGHLQTPSPLLYAYISDDIVMEANANAQDFFSLVPGQLMDWDYFSIFFDKIPNNATGKIIEVKSKSNETYNLHIISTKLEKGYIFWGLVLQRV